MRERDIGQDEPPDDAMLQAPVARSRMRGILPPKVASSEGRAASGGLAAKEPHFITVKVGNVDFLTDTASATTFRFLRQLDAK